MALDDYKVVLYRNWPSGWVAEVPSILGCYALMPTRTEVVSELEQVFSMLEAEYRDKGISMPVDTTEIVHAQRPGGRVPSSCGAARLRKMRQTGSHERWNHPDGRLVTIPIHGGRGIGPPLYNKILEQLGINSEKFRRLK